MCLLRNMIMDIWIFGILTVWKRRLLLMIHAGLGYFNVSLLVCRPCAVSVVSLCAKYEKCTICLEELGIINFGIFQNSTSSRFSWRGARFLAIRTVSVESEVFGTVRCI
uniref:Uncharacterized protein n=1 Tax=Cacopsylla melanoneura TaxID=428564 RepID=A0A8D8TR28_9HEMI